MSPVHIALGLAHSTCLDVAPIDLIRAAARTGYSHVGLRLRPSAPGGLAYELKSGSAALAEVRAAMAIEGIGVYDIETVVLNATFKPESLRPILDAGAALGAWRLNVSADDDDRIRLFDQFAQLCELAGDAGMGVDLECISWRGVNTLAKCAEIVRASGEASAGLQIDALHLHRCGGTPAQVAAYPRAMIHSAQLCDAPLTVPSSAEDRMIEARTGRLAPGDGELPLRALIAALPARAMISIEAPNAAPEDLDARLTRLAAAAQALLSPIA